MPRALRIHDPDGIYHIVIRGDNREPIFVNNTDYQQYLRLLSRFKAELEFKCYGYALMTNHVHLLLQPGDETTVSVIMQRLSATYTRYFNKRYNRVGHIYQGRFHSSLVDKEAYLLEVVRYVHLNPVRAGMVHHPRDYLWTSYHAYMAPEKDTLELIDCRLILEMLCLEMGSARQALNAFLQEGLTQQYKGLPDALFRPIPLKYRKRCQTLTGP